MSGQDMNAQDRAGKGGDRREVPAPAADPAAATFTGNLGLQLEEPLLFEQGRADKCGVDLPEPPDTPPRLGEVPVREGVGLPGLSEPEILRHFTRLSQKNYAIDSGLFPLGSCTMKHNPRLDERVARLPGFADIHPLQPQSTVPGARELIARLAEWLMILTGMPGVALSMGAGAHGELCGMTAIRAALRDRGEPRRKVLVPDSAHGTNPATAAALGYEVVTLKSTADGRVDLSAMRAALDDDTAALMITNPNTCGLFEGEIAAIAQVLHEAGAYLYCDGANFNAMVGRIRPADLGIDAMHLNLHKTFSTPHGGGGPGSGPVVFSAALEAFAPLPHIRRRDGEPVLVEHPGEPGTTGKEFGRLKAFHGQMGMFTRALAYMMSHGADGLRQVAEDAVLNANYVRAELADVMSQSYPGPCMHEVLFDESFLKDSGIGTLDFAKALLDEGYHPMTVYFPLVVRGAMLIEPTETESRASLDRFIATMRDLAGAARAGDSERFTRAPRHTPRLRLDEVRAARQPVLRWQPPEPRRDAAE